MKVTSVIRFTHRILGTVLSILFLVWFLSGLVMIYHTFPRISPDDRLMKKEVLCDSLPPLADVLERLPQGDTVKSITLDCYLGQTAFHICTSRNNYTFPADPAEAVPKVTYARIEEVAALWCDAPVERVDTLYRLEQWIPFGYLKKEFPIYKFYFADKEKHQLYIASRTGDVLQLTSRSSRFWAWAGAIPHWIYFTSLRQDAVVWGWTVIVLSGMGCYLCLAGFYMGIRACRISFRKRKWVCSPYKKRWFRWHYITGMFFGLFVLTWTFSGLMSLASIPKWFSTIHKRYDIRGVIQGERLRPETYRLDYRVLLSCADSVKQIEWAAFNGIPFYRVKTGTQTLTIDATLASVRPLNLTEAQISAAIERIHGAGVPFRIELMTEYDTYYLSRKYTLPVPVYRVTVDDADRSCYYVHPRTGAYRYVNTNSRCLHWMYPALHSFSFPWLVARPVLWYIVMWGLMLGGTLVCITSAVLASGYVRRKVRKWKR